ncbi:hypothetical protein N0V86_003152 [Didymella sp. IMI 355093]|nr:hypothetical protein N0V86_003152 [Didymella sp. IMI 355093]
MFKNPNLMPVVPRLAQTAQPSLPVRELEQHEEIEEERLPQIWHTSIDDLIRRTAHDYDLIMNYERDAEGGQRWTPGDITHIRDVGKDLHRDIFALRRWQRVVAQQGDQDKTVMMHIKREANFVKLLCERVQSVIVKYEQKCNLELLRDGVYAQDEDGNLYKPTTPQDLVAEGGYPRNVPQSSNEDIGDGSWDYLQGQDQGVHQDYDSAAWLGAPTDTRLSSSSSKRNLAFDLTFQSTPFDRLKKEDTYRKSSAATDQPPALRPGWLLDGRISKPYLDAPRGKLSLMLSPLFASETHRERSPDSTPSALSVEDGKARSRGKNNIYNRNGVSRRKARRDRTRGRSPRPTIGRLGNHKLHY